ncbi:hypothetical protein QYM41_17130 [Kocuria sp. CPCC 205268]|uniref:hypothetical protein n=1 Tax=Kocuria oxytropis TaxID=3058913 RepID=UPI0034D651B9
MPMTHYRRMTHAQAAAALGEFLTERPTALQGLRAELISHGIDPSAMLDATPGSLTPLWQWITDRRAELAADPAGDTPVEPRQMWPSWARHTVTGMRVPSATMFALLDGLVSYLTLVITTGAPNAAWRLGSPEDPSHHLHHYPVLTGSGHQIFVPTLPMVGVARLKRGEKSLRATELTEYAAAVIDALRENSHEAASPDPPVVVVAEPEFFDVGLRADIAATHSQLVDRVIAELAVQDGVTAVYRDAHDALVVNAPDWDAEDLQRWLQAWFEIRVPLAG